MANIFFISPAFHLYAAKNHSIFKSALYSYRLICPLLGLSHYNFKLIQGHRLYATLRLVDSGHILAEQRQVSARWRRGHEWAARSLSKGLSIDLSTKCREVCCVLVAESEMIPLGHHATIVAVILFRILYWICRAGKLNSSKVS